MVVDITERAAIVSGWTPNSPRYYLQQALSLGWTTPPAR